MSVMDPRAAARDLWARISPTYVLTVLQSWSTDAATDLIERSALEARIVSELPPALAAPVRDKVQRCIDVLVNEAYVTESSGILRLTPRSLFEDSVEKEVARERGWPDVPAADRYVSRSDNSSAFNEIESTLETIGASIRSSNELPLDASERAAISSEAEALTGPTKQGKVRAFWLQAIKQFAEAIKRLATRIGEKGLDAAADRLIALVLEILARSL